MCAQASSPAATRGNSGATRSTATHQVFAGCTGRMAAAMRRFGPATMGLPFVPPLCECCWTRRCQRQPLLQSVALEPAVVLELALVQEARHWGRPPQLAAWLAILVADVAQAQPCHGARGSARERARPCMCKAAWSATSLGRSCVTRVYCRTTLAQRRVVTAQWAWSGRQAGHHTPAKRQSLRHKRRSPRRCSFS